MLLVSPNEVKLTIPIAGRRDKWSVEHARPMCETLFGKEFQFECTQVVLPRAGLKPTPTLRKYSTNIQPQEKQIHKVVTL